MAAVKRFFVWLAAPNPVVLSTVPESNKLAALGGTVLATALLATAAATFTAHQFLHVSRFGALLVGAFWGLAIMNLDRWLLASMRRQRTVALTLLSGLPRIALAFVVGLVISERIVLQAFHKEIDAQASHDKRQHFTQARDDLDRTTYAPLQQLRLERDDLELRADEHREGIVLDVVPAYRRVSAELARLQRRQVRARRGIAVPTSSSHVRCRT